MQTGKTLISPLVGASAMTLFSYLEPSHRQRVLRGAMDGAATKGNLTSNGSSYSRSGEPIWPMKNKLYSHVAERN